MAASFSLGALLLVPVLVLGDISWVGSGGGIAMALFLGAIPTALAYILFARGLRHLTPGETATLTLAEPLTATGLGVLALGERPGVARRHRRRPRARRPARARAAARRAAGRRAPELASVPA